MKRILFVTLTLVSNNLLAQIPEDALRMSWVAPSGSAREQAIGGAMGSIGGDISANFVNPAGLGFYKTNEFMLSPGFQLLKTNSNYLGTPASSNTGSNFNLGTSGIVWGYTSRPSVSGAFSIAVNRTANFNSDVFFKGINDYSSFSEQFANEFADSKLTIDEGLYSTDLSYGTRMALYSYLIDTTTINGASYVIAMPEKSGLLYQESSIHNRGGITEIALGIAGNQEDKFYMGASLGIPILNFRRNSNFTEKDTTGNTNNDFSSFTYSEYYKTSGVGINFKVGTIYKLSENLRVGLAIHSPSFFGLTDEIHTKMVSNLEGYTNYRNISITSDSLDLATNSTENPIQYNFHTPWKFLFSASYLFGGGIEDVKKQKGFITADVEYVTIKSMKFKSADLSTYSDDYYNSVNDAIKYSYKGNFNVRVGCELKFNTIMARLGFAYATSPYSQKELKANKMFLTGGIGYRNRGIFIDIAYVQNISKDVNIPYRLSDANTVYSNLKNNGGTFLTTFGWKF